MDLEKLIELAKIIAKPYKITTIILAVLLLISILANVYLLSQPAVIELTANENNQTMVSQDVGK